MSKKEKAPDIGTAGLMGLLTGCVPFDASDVEQGIYKIPPIIDMFPAKMSLAESMNCYLIQDASGNRYALSVAHIARLGWYKFEFPEVDKDFLRDFEKWQKFRSGRDK